VITLTKNRLNLISTRLFSILVISLSLISCGGSSGSVDNPSVPPTDQNRGGFQSIGNPVINSIENIQAAINSAGGQNITAEYAVNTYKLEYMTLDSSNALIKVSGLIAVPEKPTPSPIISYQHATTFHNDDAPSFQLTANKESIEIALASLGYIVFSADYVGFGSSFGRNHPYLQRLPSAYAVNDMLKAAKTWIDFSDIKTNGQLFMTGYSQGGYVTMAALQDLQSNPQDGLQIVTAVMGAGPYNLSLALNELVEDSLGISLPRIDIPDFLVDPVIDIIEEAFIPDDADVGFENDFLEHFLTDDRQDDVHNWKPLVPIKLFHGDDDETVPIASAESTLNTMLNLGADIELIRCTENPSSHSNCVLPFINFMVDHFESLRTD